MQGKWKGKSENEEGSSRSIILPNQIGAVAVPREKYMGHAPIAVEDANAESALHRMRGEQCLHGEMQKRAPSAKFN